MSTQFKDRDILSIKDFSKQEIMHILKVAKKMVPAAKGKRRNESLRGKVLATIFFEPSTRTRLSFESAMSRLGGRAIGMADPEASSLKKGETLADTIKMAESYADVTVLRHHHMGAARLAAKFSAKPIINGGDGAGQHPTQTMLDLFTIWTERGKIEGQKVALVGDLKYGRTEGRRTRSPTRFPSSGRSCTSWHRRPYRCPRKWWMMRRWAGSAPS